MAEDEYQILRFEVLLAPSYGVCPRLTYLKRASTNE